MQVYLVGGAVRDALLGLPVKDRDWVVVGATPETMLAMGFRPVGKDFPVFLHPHTQEEFALARTERKSAPGYRGFVVHAAPDVTLEQDLSRRDLSINAMAVQAHHSQAHGVLQVHVDQAAAQWQRSGQLHDPFGGLNDLKQRRLRHVGPAFSEDPVRILRLARLAARLDSFEPAPETLALMQSMVSAGEVQHLVAERVWQELAKGLMYDRPSRMLNILRDCGALAVVLPELDRLHGVPQTAQHHPEIDTWAHMMLVMDMSARLHCPLTVRVACLFHDLGKGITAAAALPRHIGHEQRSVHLLQAIGKRLRVPTDCLELALVVAREHGHIHQSAQLGAQALVQLLERCDAFRKPGRFHEVLLACACDARGRKGFSEAEYAPSEKLAQALAIAQTVDTQAISAAALQDGKNGQDIGHLIRQARIHAVANWQSGQALTHEP